MNISDYEAPECPPTWSKILESIFVRQRELMDKYQEIEGTPKPPISVHLAKNQKVMKDFAWRAWEEVAESYEAQMAYDAGTVTSKDHALEELADALHFMVELLIFAGIGPDSFPDFPPQRIAPGLEEHQHRFGIHLGIAMNFLRNKPWKQSEVPTDEKRFRAALVLAFEKFLEVLAYEMNPEEMYSYYFRKSEVNKFRQRSQY